MQDVAAAHSWWKMAGLVAAGGLRPCSGAILILLVAHAMGLGWAGIAGVLAMSAGTAMTVAGLATLAVTARQTALRLADMLPGHAVGAARAAEVVGVLGGLLIATSGAVLLYAQLTAPQHPLL